MKIISGCLCILPDDSHVVVCSVQQIDYVNPLGAGEEFGLVSSLKKRGFEPFVVPVTRGEWLNVSTTAVSFF